MKHAILLCLAPLCAATVLVGACQDDAGSGPSAELAPDGADGAVAADATITVDGTVVSDASTPDGNSTGPLDPTSPFRSGSRLRARVLTNGELRVLAWMEDRELGDMRCDYQKAQDGRLRCLPSRFSSYDENYEGLVSYLDAECTQPIVVRPTSDCATIPRYARLPNPQACDGCSSAHELGERVTPGDQVYFRYRGSCGSEARRDDLEYYSVSAALPAETFVAIDYPVAAADNRVQSVGARGEDGSFVASYVRDRDATSENKQCALFPDTGGVGRCVTGPIQSMHFGDDQCTTPVASLFAGTSAQAGDTITAFMPIAACSSSVAVANYTLIAPYVGSFYARSASGSCNDVTRGGNNLWSVGGAVEPASPRAARRLVGAGRVQRTRVQTDDGVIDLGLGCTGCAPGAGHEWLLDRETGNECRVLPTGGGSFACLPLELDSSSTVHYLDAQCTQRATRVVGRPCTQAVFAVDTAPSACEEVSRVYRLGPEQTTDSLYEIDWEGECRRAAFSATVRPWLEVPASTFAPFTLERE